VLLINHEARSCFSVLTYERSSPFVVNEVMIANDTQLTSALIRFRSFCRTWAPIPLRLIVGYGFWAHGYAKLVRGPESFIGVLHALAVPAPAVFGWITVAIELGGGLAILAGAFVSVVSVPMAAVLLTAAAAVHLPYGFSSIKLQAITPAGPQFGPPGYETALLYLACLATLVMGGAGPFAIDRLREARRADAEKSVRANQTVGAIKVRDPAQR
jgi:putative oxidoreductase